MSPYRAPRLNIDTSPNFLVLDIWRPKSFGIGNATTQASMTRFVTAETMYAIFSPLHAPPGMDLSQLYCTGVHSTRASRMTEMRYVVEKIMVA